MGAIPISGITSSTPLIMQQLTPLFTQFLAWQRVNQLQKQMGLLQHQIRATIERPDNGDLSNEDATYTEPKSKRLKTQEPTDTSLTSENLLVLAALSEKKSTPPTPIPTPAPIPAPIPTPTTSHAPTPVPIAPPVNLTAPTPPEKIELVSTTKPGNNNSSGNHNNDSNITTPRPAENTSHQTSAMTVVESNDEDKLAGSTAATKGRRSGAGNVRKSTTAGEGPQTRGATRQVSFDTGPIYFEALGPDSNVTEAFVFEKLGRKKGYFIGRKPDSDVDFALSELPFATEELLRTVSRQHACVVHRNSPRPAWYLENLGRNGTKVNGVAFKGEEEIGTELHEGDKVTIGKFNFVAHSYIQT